tara:strand:+ start:57 stop:725 length:669 start_codon:yes stop_codon:yes gene_type:complete
MADNSPTSPVDICNLALTELKIDPITALDQAGSAVAELCNRHYDIRRKATLRSHIWNFAKTETTLNRSSNGSSNSYDDVYPLTNSFLRFISVGDVFVWEKNELYDIRSISINGTFKRSIVIDNDGAATLEILYIRNVTSVSEFDPLFIELLKLELANDMAPGITLKPSVRQGIKDNLADARLKARSIDGQERPPVRVQNSRFINARKDKLKQASGITTVFGS